MKLRYGYAVNNVTSLGPGRRYVLWVQGCQRDCYRCASPELQPTDGGLLVDTTELAAHITSLTDIKGITVSGGEPLLQHEALTELLSIVRDKRPELTVILFTGYRREDVRSAKALRLLTYVDLLIDGEYVHYLNDNMGLRGSSNQRLHFLSPRLLPYRQQLECGTRLREIRLIDEHSILTIGIADNPHKFVNP